jgi:hypothetical protein
MKLTKFTISILLILQTFLSFSTTEKYRLSYNGDPATKMVVGWAQNGGINTTVYFDTIDHGTNWASYAFTHGVDRNTSQQGMNHNFARLTGLTPNKAYYFVIKDSDGISARYWFKTLTNDPNVPLSIISGGDSRTNQTARQNANKLVSKLRPDFVFFGGDYTELNLFYEWSTWFDDWQLTISPDGRMYPIVAARGNHEWNNDDVYKIFDTPHPDVYYALTFGGGLLRAYTLNSEISVAGAQTTWLQNDLIANQNTVEWKIAQYHRPMRPHVSSKSEGNDQYNYWANLFFDYGVRLISESDAHTVKSTWKVKPSIGPNSVEGFEREDIGGSVYVGEGCWGAPLRSANDTKNWTRNSDVFNSFQWLKITKQRIEVKFIATDNASLVGSVNDNNRFVEPTNLDVWNPSNGGLIIIENEKYIGRPAVDITYPTNNSSFTSPQNVNIQVNATDTNGTIQHVEFFINDISIGTDNSFPYSMNWTMPTNGLYVVTAWAVDNDGYHNISDDINVYVGNINMTVKVSDANDDAEENKFDGSIDLSSSDLELAIDERTWPLSDKNQLIGVRFRGLNIPQGATITSSYIQFFSERDNSASTNISIYGEKTSNAPFYTSSNHDLSSRLRTTSMVSWSIPSWVNGNQGLTEQTPNLNSLITEIVSQPTWQIGNSMSFLFEGSGTRSSHSYDGNASLAPELFVTYNMNGVSTSTQEIIETNPINFITYPNPFTNELNIKFNKVLKEVDIKLFSLNGKLVKDIKHNNIKSMVLKLEDSLPKGSYFLKVTSNNFEITKQVVKL